MEPFWPSLFAKVRSQCWLYSFSNMWDGHLQPGVIHVDLATHIATALFFSCPPNNCCHVSQALTSVDIGSLICNVGAGGGAPAGVAAAAGAPAAGGDAPGKCSQGFSSPEAVHVPF